MSAYDHLTHLSDGSAVLERVQYFPRQLMTADDMTAEQEYFREKLRRHNRYLHGWGVVCGCEVVPNPDSDHPWQVQVCPGYVITPQGDEILIPEAVNFDLAGDWHQAHDPCASALPGSKKTADQPQVVYLAVCYAECSTRPVRTHPAGCACEEAACEYSRVRESFELTRLWKLPDSHKLTKEAEQRWIQDFRGWYVEFQNNNILPQRAPACPGTADDNCVVLATIELPKDRNTPIAPGENEQIRYHDRRVLYSAVALYGMIQTMMDLNKRKKP